MLRTIEIVGKHVHTYMYKICTNMKQMCTHTHTDTHENMLLKSNACLQCYVPGKPNLIRYVKRAIKKYIYFLNFNKILQHAETASLYCLHVLSLHREPPGNEIGVTYEYILPDHIQPSTLA